MMSLSDQLEQVVTCRRCEWQGQVKDCKQREVSTSLASWQARAGREGFAWDCPECGTQVHTYYWRVS